MPNTLRHTIIVLMLTLAPINGYAETVYVTDKLFVSLRDVANEAAPATKTLESGTMLEVVERLDRFTRVRDKQGAEGWVDARYLVSEPPARQQQGKLQEELAKSRTQTAETQAQLKKLEAALTEQTAKLKEMEKTAAELPPMPVPIVMPVVPDTPPISAAATSPLVEKSPTTAGFRFSLAWLVISFAMLGAGFAGGVIWVRESIRKRSGGMYLRI